MKRHPKARSVIGSAFNGYKCAGGCGLLIMPGEPVIHIREGVRAPDGIAFESVEREDFWHQDCWGDS
jgi:hypothetical protein